jgi:hypothetical protein
VCEKPLYDRVFLCSLAFGFEANLPHGGHSVALRISRRARFEPRVECWRRLPAASRQRGGCKSRGSRFLTRAPRRWRRSARQLPTRSAMMLLCVVGHEAARSRCSRNARAGKTLGSRG